jgi:hypothetical protein
MVFFLWPKEVMNWEPSYLYSSNLMFELSLHIRISIGAVLVNNHYSLLSSFMMYNIKVETSNLLICFIHLILSLKHQTKANIFAVRCATKSKKSNSQTSLLPYFYPQSIGRKEKIKRKDKKKE